MENGRRSVAKEGVGAALEARCAWSGETWVNDGDEAMGEGGEFGVGAGCGLLTTFALTTSSSVKLGLTAAGSKLLTTIRFATRGVETAGSCSRGGATHF